MMGTKQIDHKKSSPKFSSSRYYEKKEENITELWGKNIKTGVEWRNISGAEIKMNFHVSGWHLGHRRVGVSIDMRFPDGVDLFNN